MTEQQTAATEVVPTPHLVVHAVLRTDVGRVRSENQDFGALTSDEESSHRGGARLLIVADGMGGHRGGATASKLAGETVKSEFMNGKTDDLAVALHDALARANVRIFTEAQANPDLKGMGTTTSALVVRDSEGWFGHVGDSRIYLVRGGEIRQLTEDHSLVASMVREGLLTPKEAENHPRRNVLQRSMGVAEDVEIDVAGPFPVEEGDTFILCSDGLHGPVKEEEIKQVASRPIDEAADEFLRLALERGAPDNVTVIVARAVTPDQVTKDRRKVETQPMPAADSALFEETHRDGIALDDTLRDRVEVPPPAPVITAPVPERPLSDTTPVKALRDPLPSSAPPMPERFRPTVEVGVISAGQPSDPGNVLFKWFMIVLMALGAAAAWLYWTR